jgi:uncharacterized protein YqeY
MPIPVLRDRVWYLGRRLARCPVYSERNPEPALPKGKAGFSSSRRKRMSLKAKITEDMKAAMKGGEKDRLAVIRLIQAQIKQREVDERIELDDAQVLAALEKMQKQRRDSIEQFDKAGRTDLSAIERYEMGVIDGYLPTKLDEAELDAIIGAAIAESGATTARDMGKVVALVKEKATGRADMAAVAGKVKAKLA